jgi:protein disulfide-isomerase
VNYHRNFALFLLVIALFSPAGLLAEEAPTPVPEPRVVWLENYNDALAKAKAENKRVLVNFTGSDWCYFCIKMDKEVLSTASFAAYADKNLVLLKVDFPRNRELPATIARQNQALGRQFGVQGYPTFVVLDSNGGERDRRAGYQPGGPENFIRFLKVSEPSDR